MGGRNAWILFGVAAGVRLLAVFLLHSPSKAEGLSAWEWGGESACLAQSLADGRGYGDPWAKGTGPSGWLTPPYPALLAFLLQAFGGVGSAAATALFAVQAVASAGTCVLVLRLGEALGLGRSALLGAWLFAVYPPSIWHAAQTVWDTTFAALALTAFLVALIRTGAGLGEPLAIAGQRAFAAGIGYGLVLFVNPAPLSIAPAVLFYVWLEAGGVRGTRIRQRAAVSAAFVLGTLLVCLPWMARNARQVGSFSLRPNYGVELRLGNNDGSRGRPEPLKFHPSHVPEELALYRELGEGGYAKNCERRAKDWIVEHPRAFALLTLRRMQFFWLGEPPPWDVRTSEGKHAGGDPLSWLKFLAFSLTGAGALLALPWLELRRSQLVLVGGSLALFGLPYFVTHVSERYRFAVDPLIVLLGAWLFCRLLAPWTTFPRARFKGGAHVRT